jgi:hypothetical protein
VADQQLTDEVVAIRAQLQQQLDRYAAVERPSD